MVVLVSGVVAGDEVVDRVVVFSVLLTVAGLPAGEGLMMVVLFPAGEAPPAGVTSVRCSQPERSAALARMQMICFIIRMGCPWWDKQESEARESSALSV